MTNKIRPRITPEEYEIVKKARRIEAEARKSGLDPNDVKHMWIKDKHSFFVPNPGYRQKEQSAFHEALVDLVRNHSISCTPGPKRQLKEGKLLVIDPADVHIGKLANAFETGENYNTEIAIQRVHEGVDGILDKIRGVDIERIVFIGGNDILHVDNSSRTTTRGTPQDTDVMWYDAFLKAMQLYLDVLKKLIDIADVQYIHCMSNHDYVNGWMLSQCVQAYFEKHDRISFDTSPKHRKYVNYGQNLLGFTHGDGAKQKDLPILMANEAKTWWSQTKHRYIYSHHVHHKTGKDYPGVVFETLRSPSGTDAYHHKNGYQHAPMAIEAFVHDRKYGQEMRISHFF